MRRFGVRFDRMDLEVAYQRGQKFKQSDVQRLRDSIVNNPRCAKVDVPDEQIFKTLRFGMAIHDMATEGGYIGCTVKSWPELFDYYGCAIDGAVSMLNDAGLCTVEEGEMNGLLSSMAMHLLSQGKAIPTLMDLSAADAATNRLGIWHCGACPTRIMKPGASFEARKHTILENGNPQTAVGLMIEFLLAHGPATVVRYQAPDAARMIAFEGNLVETPMAFRGAYCEMEPTAGTTAAQILNTIMSDGLDHHWSLGYGHLKDDLLMLNHFIGVENIAIRRNNVMSGLSTW